MADWNSVTTGLIAEGIVDGIDFVDAEVAGGTPGSSAATVAARLVASDNQTVLNTVAAYNTPTGSVTANGRTATQISGDKVQKGTDLVEIAAGLTPASHSAAAANTLIQAEGIKTVGALITPTDTSGVALTTFNAAKAEGVKLVADATPVSTDKITPATISTEKKQYGRDEVALAASPPVATGETPATIAGLIEAQANAAGQAAMLTDVRNVYSTGGADGAAAAAAIKADADSKMQGKVSAAQTFTLGTVPVRGTWTTLTYYNGDFVFPTVPGSYCYEATGAGTTAVLEPTWPTTLGATVIDGTVTWTCRVKSGVSPSAAIVVATVEAGAIGAALALVASEFEIVDVVTYGEIGITYGDDTEAWFDVSAATLQSTDQSLLVSVLPAKSGYTSGGLDLIKSARIRWKTTVTDAAQCISTSVKFVSLVPGA